MAKRSIHDAAVCYEQLVREASMPSRWDGPSNAAAIRAQVSDAEAQGLLDPALLDEFEMDLIELIEAEFAEHVLPFRDVLAVDIAEAAFGKRTYANRLDTQLATGAAALADTVMEAYLAMVASMATLNAFATAKPLRPAWPSAAAGDASGAPGSPDVDPGSSGGSPSSSAGRLGGRG